MRNQELYIFFTKLTISIVTVLLMADFSYAQVTYSPRMIRKMNSSAKEFFRIQEYRNALPLYKTLDSLMPQNAEYSYRLGICYLNSNYKSKALKHLLKAMGKPKIPEEQHFYLARAYHLNHAFDNAIEHYEKYLNLIRTKKDAKEQIRHTERLIEMCRNGKELMLSPQNVTVKNLGPAINSPYDDFAPLVSIDEKLLIFTSKRVDQQQTGAIENSFEDIYFSIKVDGEWQPAQNIGAPINTNNHDAAVGLSPDGQKLFIYKARNTVTLNHGASGDLYMSKKEGEKWTEPQLIPGEINTKFWEPSASITENEQMLFFTSDRDGGLGGRDIYMAKKLPNGEWAKPRNLGDVINTPYDEDGPFIHPSGTRLYFSSKGHNSMGGFDIFRSEYNIENDTWSKPVNLGYPINTADDDIYFVWSADEKRAYFSSAREDSYGETDIYMVYKKEDQLASVVVEGGIYNTEDHKPVFGSILVRDEGDKSIIGIYETDPETGKYTMILKSGRVYLLETNIETFQENITKLSIPEAEDFHKIDKNIYIDKTLAEQLPVDQQLDEEVSN
jgi:tetratricopeptide (TPR) repeat protein